MRRIVVSDIFGRTPELERLCDTVASKVEIVDPYSGRFMEFRDEAQAYETFMTTVGLARYGGILQEKLKTGTTVPVFLAGFSVGASVIWKASRSLDHVPVVRAVCFYGSQIRLFPEIHPMIKIDLVLPKREPGFCVRELALQLSGKSNVELHTTPYLHGFMNPLSKNFSPAGYEKYANWLRALAR